SLGPSMRDASGTPICVRTPGDPTSQIIYIVRFDDGSILSIPCVPLNVLAATGKIPLEQLKNLTFKDAGNGTDSQRTLLATAGGRIAELPNPGDISVSFGVDYRYEIGTHAPPDVASVGYTTDNFAKATEGRFHLFEGFGDLSIVPFSAHDIAKWV